MAALSVFAATLHGTCSVPPRQDPRANPPTRCGSAVEAVRGAAVSTVIRAALLALALIPMPVLATEPKCIVVPPHPVVCTFGPAGAGFPEGAMVFTCDPVPQHGEEVKP